MHPLMPFTFDDPINLVLAVLVPVAIAVILIDAYLDRKDKE